MELAPGLGRIEERATPGEGCTRDHSTASPVTLGKAALPSQDKRESRAVLKGPWGQPPGG